MLTWILTCTLNEGVSGQGAGPPPPPPSNAGSTLHNGTGNKGETGAPIGGGVEILIALGALYTVKKMVSMKMKEVLEKDPVGGIKKHSQKIYDKN